nr:MAG TPA: hypothetical protein [Caudoviricetes sp.]
MLKLKSTISFRIYSSQDIILPKNQFQNIPYYQPILKLIFPYWMFH